MVHVLAAEASQSTHGRTAAVMETTITGRAGVPPGHVTSGGGTGARRRCVGGAQTR